MQLGVAAVKLKTTYLISLTPLFNHNCGISLSSCHHLKVEAVWSIIGAETILLLLIKRVFPIIKPGAGQRPHEQELFRSVFSISLKLHALGAWSISFSCLNRASDHQNQAHRCTVPFSKRLKSPSQIALCRMGGELVMYEIKLQRMTDGSEIQEWCSQRSQQKLFR